MNAWPEIPVLTQPYFESIYYLVGSTVSVNRGKVLLLSSFEAISCNLLKGMTLSHTQTSFIKVILFEFYMWNSHYLYCIAYNFWTNNFPAKSINGTSTLFMLNACNSEVPAFRFPCKDPVNPCKHLQWGICFIKKISRYSCLLES